MIALIAMMASAARAAPLTFEANRGQAAKDVRFLTRGGGITLELTPHETIVRTNNDLVKIRLADSRPNVSMEGEAPLAAKTHYYIGNDPRRWVTDVPHYARLRCRGVYAGIDVVYHASERSEIEFDFIVAPHADPRRIVLSYAGVDELRVDPAGDLLMRTPGGTLRQRAPFAYQEIDGARAPVRAQYELQRGHRVGLRVDAYDPNRELVIDPVLVFLTYLGGSGSENQWGEFENIAIDGSGNVYVTGATDSADFPGSTSISGAPSSGLHQAFVTKFNPTGTAAIYSVFLGGSSTEEGRAIAVSAAGEVYLTGHTNSSNFPVTAGAFQSSISSAADAFVAKLNAQGKLVYSSFLGGSGYDAGRDVAVDEQGRSYVTGFTSSMNFPTSAAAFQKTLAGNTDTFVAKFDSSLQGPASRIYSTFLGGSLFDAAESIAADGGGNAYVTGVTESSNFPTKNAAQATFHGGIRDAFVTKINSSGSALIYSTFLGGNFQDIGRGIAVRASGEAYATGYTEGGTFVATPGAFDPSYNSSPCCGPHDGDAYVTRLNASGGILASTFLGGELADYPDAIALDPGGEVVLTGHTYSAGFPVLQAIQSTPVSGTPNTFVTRLNATLEALVWSTYLGGGNGATGSSIAAGPGGSTCIAGRNNGGLPTTIGAFRRAPAGGHEIYVMCMRECADKTIDITTGRLNGRAIPIGAEDAHWTVRYLLGPNFGRRAEALFTPPWVAPPANAQWISFTRFKAPAGSLHIYEYRFPYDLGASIPNRVCTLAFEWAVDNDVIFWLDNGPIFARTDRPGQTSSFTTLHRVKLNIPASGAHVLHAGVVNSGFGTGLLVVGQITCGC